MKRREVLRSLAAAAFSGTLSQAGRTQADFRLAISPVTVELAPGKLVKTIGYNGTTPGPLLRLREGERATIDVYNDTDVEELVHWHGLHIPSEVDGSHEEGTPAVPAHGHRRYSFAATPSGTRWYHTHTMAGRDLKRATYTGQFGFFIVDPKRDRGSYDQEVFLALKEWNPHMTGEDDPAGTLDAAYEYFSINDRALGHGAPIRVKERQRVLFRILNASATVHRRVALAGHKFLVTAMDGNPLALPKETATLELGPAERIDAIVEMNQSGVWIFGTTDDHDREAGMGIVVEYAGQSGTPRWLPPGNERWDYRLFGTGATRVEEAERIPLVFEKNGFQPFPGARFREFGVGRRWMDKWTINGKSYPQTDPIRVKANGRYRLVFDNRSDEAHPLHLHRHTFELTKVDGIPTAGVQKDVVMVRAKSQMEVDLVANNPGPTLFHCHQQMHMDYGFMALMQYS
jgi:FtsP/CotA-like multicopper oxidase with cupredoxin domain